MRTRFEKCLSLSNSLFFQDLLIATFPCVVTMFRLIGSTGNTLACKRQLQFGRETVVCDIDVLKLDVCTCEIRAMVVQPMYEDLMTQRMEVSQRIIYYTFLPS